jgi:hypothetical protein
MGLALVALIMIGERIKKLCQRKRVTSGVSCCRCGVEIFVGDKADFVRIGERNYLEHKGCKL